MKTLFRVFAFALLALSLVGCNLSMTKSPTATPTLDQNEIATQVQQMLASVPPETQLPTQSVIQSQATATQPATATAAPSETPTPVIQTSPTAAQATAKPTAADGTGTPAATPRATSNAPDPKTTLGKPTRADTFDTTQFWFPFSDSHTKMTIANGFLTMTALHPDSWSSWTLTSPKVSNFYLEVTAKPETCDGLDTYGPMLRAPDATDGYLFGVSCDGQYRFVKVAGNNFTELIKWTPSSAIQKGANQTNRLGVMAKGEQFTLYINGTQVDQVSDSAYGSGAFGLFIAAAKTANFTVQVDEVDYWNQP